MDCLPPDLQIYILAKDPKLLLIASYLSKSFHHRSLPYLYHHFRYQPLSSNTIINYIITHSPTKWSYVPPILYHNLEMARFYTCLRTQDNYQRESFYTFYTDDSTNTKYLHIHPNDSIGDLIDPTYLKAIYYNWGPWLFDLVTLSQVLTQRKFCCQQDPNYIRNYLLNYLSNLLQKAKGKMEKMNFFMYLILNLLVYGQESLPKSIYLHQDLDDLIKVKYEKLVCYLQNN